MSPVIANCPLGNSLEITGLKGDWSSKWRKPHRGWGWRYRQGLEYSVLLDTGVDSKRKGKPLKAMNWVAELDCFALVAMLNTFLKWRNPDYPNSKCDGINQWAELSSGFIVLNLYWEPLHCVLGPNPDKRSHATALGPVSRGIIKFYWLKWNRSKNKTKNTSPPNKIATAKGHKTTKTVL